MIFSLLLSSGSLAERLSIPTSGAIEVDGSAAPIELLAPSSEELTQSVFSPYSFVATKQNGVPVQVSVSNVSSVPVIVQYITPVFYVSTFGDRQGDYIISGDFNPDVVIMPGENHTFDFSIDVSDKALTNTDVTVDAVCYGVRLDNYAEVRDSTAEETDSWVVLEQVINTSVALFDTRFTADRSDDSLISYLPAETFPLNTNYKLNGGSPIADLVMDGQSMYRLVVEINPSSDWDFEPKNSLRGYLAIKGNSTAFGRMDSPAGGVRELLLPNFFLQDMESEPIDVLVGCTVNSTPAIKWGMMSDPFSDPDVDSGRLGEYGTLKFAAPQYNNVIDCIDGSKNWEVTGKCEADRYYFYEIWFMPDYEWQHGDTADVLLHIEGVPDPSNIDGLHILFNVVDDDITPPTFGDFSPSVVPEGNSFDISCKITDESGVYDESAGSSGQGVYLKWDTDGELENDFNEIPMSVASQDYYTTDWSLGPFPQGTVIVYQVCACDNDLDGADPADRDCGCSDLQTITIVGSAYVIDDPGTLYPWWAYRGETGATFHIDISNPSSYGLWLYPTSNISFVSGTDTVRAFLNNWTWVVSGSANFTLSFSPVDIPQGFAAPDSLRPTLDFYGEDEYGQFFHQTWDASEFNTLYILEPTLHFVSYSIPSGTINPGERLVPMLLFEVANDSPFDASIDSMVINNATHGAAAVPLSDVDFDNLYLLKYVNSGSVVSAIEGGGAEEKLGGGVSLEEDSEKQAHRIHFRNSSDKIYPAYIDRLFSTDPDILERDDLSASDSLIAVSTFFNGRTKLSTSSSGTIPAGSSTYFFLLADVDSFMATDGDSLDVEIVSPDSVYTTGIQSKLFHDSPLNSDGAAVVDGCMSFQLKLEGTGIDTIFSGDTLKTILKAVIPVNGYISDVLTGIAIKNFSDPGADTHLDNLKLWIDDGDGIFDSSRDSLICRLFYTGEFFEASGIHYILNEPRRVFVTADVKEDFSENLSLGFGIPLNGITYASGNDGPVDIPLYPDSTITVVRREYVSVEPVELQSGFVYPGEEDAELLGFSINNKAVTRVTLDSLIVTLAPELRDCGFIITPKLFADNGDRIFSGSSDTLVASGTLIDSVVVFKGIGSSIDQSNTRCFFVVSSIDSFKTVDGLNLTAYIKKSSDIYLSRQSADIFDLEGVFPLVSPGGAVTDGMMSFQIGLRAPKDSTIIDKKVNIEILRLTIHGNGCLDDTLKALTVKNYGTADASHIKSLSLWKDNGDGIFDPSTDDSLSTFLSSDGIEYRLSGLSVPLQGYDGAGFFVTANLNETIETGATIRAGVPVMGVEVASGNDGPIDRNIESESSLVIPVPDRITFFASSLNNKRVHPGDSHVLNMVLGAYNSYRTSQVLDNLTILNVGSVDPEEISEVSAYADINEDGLFDADSDSLMQVAKPTGSGYVFENLNFTLSPYKNTVLFVAYSILGKGVRDSVKVDFQVSNEASIVFENEKPNIQGEFPLNSAGVDITDGMVASELSSIANGSKRVSPKDKNVPCFSIIVPCNGTLQDLLESVKVINLGTALPGLDIEYLKLWKESGAASSGFDAAEDEFLDFLAWDGSVWKTISTLNDTIFCNGLVLHVTADISQTASDGKTIQLSLPLRGVQVYSGNDGPIDIPFVSSDLITITTDPLFSSIEVPQRVTVGQQFEARMRVSNAADTSLHMVEPDSFSYSGDGALSLLGGPEPARIEELPGQSDSVFVWRFEAALSGSIVFCGKTHEVDGTESSLLSCSDSLIIDKVPENFILTIDDLAPVSINRGRDNVAVLQMKLKYSPPYGEGALVRLSGLKVRFENASGIPIASSSVASFARIEDDQRILGSKDLVGSNSPEAEILANQYSPVFAPGDSSVIRLSINVPDTAAAADFRMTVESTSWIYLKDENSQDQVVPVGTAFPWSSNDITIKDPAQELTIKSTAVLPEHVNKGQSEVEALLLTLVNGSGSSSADISVSEIRFKVVGSQGDTLLPQDVLDFFSIKDDLGNSHFSTSNLSSQTIECKFNPSLAVSAGIPLNLHVLIGCGAQPKAGAFSLVIVDSLSISARDVNSGQFVEVVCDTSSGSSFPISSGIATILSPAQKIAVSGQGLLPGISASASTNLHAISMEITHPGSSDESPARCDRLAVRLLNERGERIKPFGLIHAIRLFSSSHELGSVYLTEENSSLVEIPFSSSLILNPGDIDTLDMFVDLSSSAKSGYFQLHVDAGAIGLFDQTDGKRIDDVDGDFPITSGICEIAEPAQDVLVHSSSILPANVAVGSEVAAFDFGFALDDTSNSIGAVLEKVRFEVIRKSGARVDPSAVIKDVMFELDSDDVSSEWAFVDQGIEMHLVDSVFIRKGEVTGLKLKLVIADNPSVDIFAIKIPSGDDFFCSDILTHARVPVAAAEGAAFPLVSSNAAILSRKIEDSFSNYPNPFVAGRDRTRITFYLPEDSKVTLRVFTLTGMGVKTIIDNEYLPQGLYQDYYWDGKNGRGLDVLNGVYYLVLDVSNSSGKERFKRKVAVVR